MRRSTLAVCVNDEQLCEEKFAYPDNIDGGSKSAVSIAFARSESGASLQTNQEDYRFQMCAMGVLQGSLQETEMQQLYLLHHGPSYSLCETAAVDEWAVIQQRFLEKVGDDERMESDERWIVLWVGIIMSVFSCFSSGCVLILYHDSFR